MIYNTVKIRLREANTLWRQHIACTIAKSDELKGLPELKNLRDLDTGMPLDVSLLFEDVREGTALNADYIEGLNALSKGLFKQLVIGGDDAAAVRFCQRFLALYQRGGSRAGRRHALPISIDPQDGSAGGMPAAEAERTGLAVMSKGISYEI